MPRFQPSRGSRSSSIASCVDARVADLLVTAAEAARDLQPPTPTSCALLQQFAQRTSGARTWLLGLMREGQVEERRSRARNGEGAAAVADARATHADRPLRKGARGARRLT